MANYDALSRKLKNRGIKMSHDQLELLNGRHKGTIDLFVNLFSHISGSRIEAEVLNRHGDLSREEMLCISGTEEIALNGLCRWLKDHPL